jgi:heme/copper-type cytochrome/quinol oxidase subunit 3
VSDGDPREREGAGAAGTFGLWLFLAALTMLFAASVVGYVVIRIQAERQGLATGAIRLPRLLWLSTAAVVGVSIAIARAVAAFPGGRRRGYRNALTAALVLATGFVTIQTPALIILFTSNAAALRAARSAAVGATTRPAGTALYGLLFFLILVHALHVAGGVVALWRLAARVHRGTTDWSDPRPVKHAAMYWHFLDAVWLVMFVTFYALR